MALFLIFALQCLFPIFDLGSGEWIGISTVNTDSQPREFTVTTTSPDGLNTQTGRFTLAAGAQRSNLLRELLETASQPQSGWIRIDSGSQNCTSYLAEGSDHTLAGTDAASTGTVVLLPHVAVNTGFMELNHTDTQIIVVNPNGNLANIAVQLIGQDGAARGTVPFNVSGAGSRIFRVSEAFANVLPNNNVGGKTFEGYLRITSNATIAAWQRVETPLTRSMLRGKSLSEITSTSQVLIPSFIFNGTYRSTVNLVNPTGSPLSLELTAVSSGGQNLGETRNVTLTPGEVLRGSVGSIFRMVIPAIFPPPTIEGHIRIRQSQGGTFQLLGDIEVSTESSSVMHPLSDTAGTTWTMPLAVGTSPWTTFYVVANPNELLTVQTDVQIEEVTSSGVVARRSSISLSPRSRQAGVVVSPLAGGYLRFASNFPVVVIGSVGTTDGQYVDQVPSFR